MKKLVTGLLSTVALISTLNADFARVEMGVGGWNQSPSGTISYTDATLGSEGTYTSKQVDNTSTYVWALIKHPIPILPNLRLEYTDIDDQGSAKGSFEDFDTGGLFKNASISMKQYDIIPYYNLLDNTAWTTLDLGLDIKVVDASYKAQAVNIFGIGLGNYEDSKTIAIPLVYARVRVEIPATNIGLESDVKYITYDGSTIYDVRAKVDYTLDMIPVLHPGLEVGYRMQKFDLTSDDDKTKMNMEFKGFYAGLMLRF